MSLIRQFLPEKVNNGMMYVFGRVWADIQYYYDDTFSANEVYKNIYIGDLASSVNKDAMKEKGITHILSIVNGCYEMYPEDFTYKIIHINDDRWVQISDYFDECVKFIKDAVDSDGKVLVHCKFGVSRSVTSVLAYMMTEKGMTLDTSLKIVQSKRPQANPNRGFRLQLIEYAQSKKFASAGATSTDATSTDTTTDTTTTT